MKISRLFTSLIALVSITACTTNSSNSNSGVNSSTSEIPPIQNVENVRGNTYYEIFVRSFADSNNDGIGDLNGITAKLDYLAELGIGGIWLTPIHPSPSYHGYDVDDYFGVSKDLGTIADFENLVKKADEKNIDIIIDLVLNHSSKDNPWFVEGFNNYKSGNFDVNDNTNKANWYNFSGTGSSSTYEANFGSWMPEFDLANPVVIEKFNEVASFWLEKGVKGFRLDAMTYYFYADIDRSVDYLNTFVTHVKSVKPDAYIVGEAWTSRTEYNKFYNAKIDSTFNFASAENKNSAHFVTNINASEGARMANYINIMFDEAKSIYDKSLVASFLSNHDMDRPITTFTGPNPKDRAKLAASLYLFLPGVPFIYYGEEIGMLGIRSKAETDANRRLPMIFSSENDTYQTSNHPGHDFDMNRQVTLGANDLLSDPNSLTNHYKNVLAIKNKYPWIKDASIDNIDLGSKVLAGFKIFDDNNSLYLIHNFDTDSVELERSIIEEQNLQLTEKFIYNSISKINDNKVIIGGNDSIIMERL